MKARCSIRKKKHFLLFIPKLSSVITPTSKPCGYVIGQHKGSFWSVQPQNGKMGGMPEPSSLFGAKTGERWLKCRKTAIEPMFDLFSKVLGTVNNHKQLPLQCLPKVRPFLCLGVLAVQIAMIINNVYGLPFSHISSILSALS